MNIARRSVRSQSGVSRRMSRCVRVYPVELYDDIDGVSSKEVYRTIDLSDRAGGRVG